MRRERRKKINNFNPQTMLHLEYSLRTEKKHLSTKAHIPYTHDLQQGEHIQLWQAAVRSSAIYYGAGRRPARQVAVQSVTEGVEWGRGVMSVVGDGSKRVPLHRSLRVVIQTALAKAPVRGARKDKIELLWLLGRTAANLHSSFSLSILISEFIKFHLQSC